MAKLHSLAEISDLNEECVPPSAPAAERARIEIDRELHRFVEKSVVHPALARYMETAHRILLSGDAKRVRSILPVLIAEQKGFAAEECLKYGVSIEFLHYASLIHDDVIDADGVRRGIKTLNARFSNSHAVLIGDFMMSAVIEYALEFAHGGEVIRQFVQAIKKLVTGLVIEQTVMSLSPSYENYLEMAELKTGALFELALGLPFLGTGQAEQARRCGRLFGLLFQIYDDFTDQDTDGRHYNIFHIMSEEEIQNIWQTHYREMTQLATELGITGPIQEMINYLQTKGYFQSVPASQGALFHL